MEELGAEVLSKVVLSRPTTYGGIVKNPALLDKVFLTHTVPDILPNTRILAVCGITDYEDQACPDEDGWFISDFYAFNFLLRGQGAAQSWLTTESPKYLVSKYKEYLHGAPHKPRKVVLDNDMMSDGPQSVQLVSRHSLLEEFLSTLKQECTAARKENQPVLVLMFGHGDALSHGVYLGLEQHGEETLYPLLEMDKFKEAIGDGIAVTILSTACYSGGWAINPKLNTTTFAAARPGQSAEHPEYITGESESWSPSKSLGRVCGSIFATSIISALAAEDAPIAERDPKIAESNEAEAAASEQDRSHTFRTFVNTIHQILCTRLDKWSATHDIRFSAQDDEWSMEWHARSGLPLSHYASKWDTLREIPTHPSSNLPSRDPRSTNTENGPNQLPRGTPGSLWLGRAGSAGITQGKLATMKAFVLGQARLYMSSFPGRDTVASNTSLHNAINMLSQGRPFTFEKLAKVHSQIEYRLKAMDVADFYLSAVGLASPGNVRCSQWDIASLADIAKERRVSSEHFQQMVSTVGKANLFPPAGPPQGVQFPKVYNFIAAALLNAQLDAATVQVVLQEMVSSKAKVIAEQVDGMSRI
ncbi:MAG: hypothetical protein Q9191_005127 [Dirinaria sp. TL-2023a]